MTSHASLILARNAPAIRRPLAEPGAPACRPVTPSGRRQLFVGASSWKYEGWLNRIYSPERYLTKGRFSSKRFEQECLIEYAETFSIVCGDFAFYQFPTPAFWKKLFDQVPAPFQFAFKVPEEIALPVSPGLPRYGLRAAVAIRISFRLK
jgi:hypothetical protein